MNNIRLLMCSGLLLGASVAGAKSPQYPAAVRVDTVDTYFGTAVADPYRWLEDDNSRQTAEWVAAENKVTQAYLSKIPFRADVRKRLTELANFEKWGTPFIVKNKYYYFRNDGLQNQSVLYVRDSLTGPERVVLDPNTLSADGTVALQQLNFSNNGRYMAYVITRNGSDWNEIYVLDLLSGKTLDDHIRWAKFTDAQWLGDGFFYSAYDAPESELSSKNEFHKVCYHKIGTPQSADYVEYADAGNPLLFHQAVVLDKERYVVIDQSDGEANTLLLKILADVNPHYVRLCGDGKSVYNPIGVEGKWLYVMTNADAPRWKIIAFDISAPHDAPREVVSEQDAVLSDARMANHHFILTYDKDASSHPAVYSLDGQLLRTIDLPTFGSVGISSRNYEKEVFYSFTSYTTPTRVYSYDMTTGKSKLLFQPTVALNPDDYQIDQVFYPSKDGTRIPMFLIYKKGLRRDGQRPVFLYGYGGFNISMNPAFSYSRTPFAMLDQGGICAYTNLRGGGEYGEQWHEAGTKMQKQNVFDDFIAAGEYLINEGYTRAGLIACNGGSNGGLLVGAVVNQRPDLFGAAVPQVGVMDMLRYHLFTIGWNWARDYGRSDDNEQMFRYLRNYSPLHNIRTDGTHYPPIMITTSDHDDRVVPAHSFKYAATLQAANTGDAVKLIRIDVNAGHGHGKPIAKVIDEYTDIQSFIMYNLGVKYTYRPWKRR